jgi:hypothetical protein
LSKTRRSSAKLEQLKPSDPPVYVTNNEFDEEWHVERNVALRFTIRRFADKIRSFFSLK